MPEFNDVAYYAELTSPERLAQMGAIADPNEALPENQTKWAYWQTLMAFGMFANTVKTVTASANVDLEDSDYMLVDIDPNGSDRDVNLPAAGNANHPYLIRNSGSANTLTIKLDGGTAIAVLQAGTIALISPSVLEDFAAIIGTGGVAIISENLLINGGHNVAQQGTSFTAATTPANNNDTYLLDQCILLSDGNDIVDVSLNALTAEQNNFYMRALVATANKKFGYLYPIENKDSPQEGEKVSLSLRVRTTAAAIENIRAAIISWDGTADSITSDVVSAWAVEGTNPTLAANWTYENTPSNLALTTDWQTFTIENVDIDTSGVNNVAVFIWCDDTDAAVNDVLDIQWVKLELGQVATSFQRVPYADELSRCLRYFFRTKSDQTVGILAQGVSAATTYARALLVLPVRMRVTPTTIGYSTIGIQENYAGAVTAATSIAFVANYSSRNAAGIQVNVSGGLTVGTLAAIVCNSSADAYIEVGARL